MAMSPKSLPDLLYTGMALQPELTANIFAALDKDAPVWKADMTPNREVANIAGEELLTAGSHSFWSNRSYAEIVEATCKKVGAEPASTDHVVENERRLLQKMFADAWDQMSPSERAAILSDQPGVSGSMLSATGTLAVQLLLKQFGGFMTYRISLIVANTIARAVLGRGLTFAANATLTRVLGAALGPAGWAVSGIWLALDIAGPAWRKVLPATVFTATLRSALAADFNIGIVGDGSTGKDATVRAVFENNEARPDPVAGSTGTIKFYPLAGSAAKVANFPGFNDWRQEVDRKTDAAVGNCRAFLVVVDASRGASNVDIQIVDKIRKLGQPMLVVLNKWDVVRERDRSKVEQNAREKLGLAQGQYVTASFDPLADGQPPAGVSETRLWLRATLMGQGVAVPTVLET